MRGEVSTGRKAKRHPYDWYVEWGWEWEQIVSAIGLEEAADLERDVAQAYGHAFGHAWRGQGVH